MLKRILPSLLTAAMALVSLGATAQSMADERGRNWCGAVAEQERYFSQHPDAAEAQKALYRKLEAREQIVQRSTAGTSSPDVTIPVVVHVIHSGGTDNISDRQIYSAIEQLNLDYQKQNGDTANTLAQFRPIAASLGFQFRLAKKDPNGNCTTGITRHYAPSLTNDDYSGAVQAVSVWDRNRYLNIWVVGSIGTPTAGGGIVLGYSNLPQNSTATRDGFVVRGDWFGNQGTSNPTRALSRTATHEIGHYFGLLHPWGGNNNPEVPGYCSDTDFVADTPPTNGTFSCNLNYAPCGDVANVQNFMDYATCPTMFTQGQKARMRDVLNTIRTGLTTPANLVATGTNDGYAAPDCAPIAAFAAVPGASTNVCVNTTVSLRDYSSNFSSTGGTLTYTWSFPGGNPSTATGQNVTVSYPTAGYYPVTETVSNSIGTSSSTVTDYIRVEGPSGGETAPFAESFENSNFPNLFNAPTLRNYIVTGATSSGTASNFRWAWQAALPAADGSAYLVVNDRSYPAGAVTTLITPNINLSGVSNSAVLSFSRAFALRSAGANDQLRISFSNDCGVNWSSPTVLDVTQLTTQGLTPIDGYVPANSSEWQQLVVPIPAQFQGSGLFKVRLQMVNSTTQGNSFYLDNLRVSAPLATKADALANHGISVYPNPLTNETAVHLNLTGTTQVQLSLTDVLGRNVLNLPTKMYGAGPQSLSLQTAGRALRAGVYVVRISLNGETYTSKLTVN
ncbi:M43 family zinc metalloprotease [Hymenobacter sp. BT770]|uniref:M43 family zinc metalloprotease n=1 Tax=Hymenobacter sp. BT770 TaxID=2886942 RepID=UPI001D12C8C1|nr:M43 family zinc metalloprotease [Hymenobacter sp. BT770]MCC3152933.1 T9SS type A sorting domain-containing protein [Hymenobacter sp. BT770]MDO3415153.1 M43 family zinc metalloprotease [Hymenobacter sp. BT770]